MAYNKRYNPDALPAHAEPDQAAAILSGSSTQSSSSSSRLPTRTDSYSSRTQPSSRDDRDRREDRYSSYDRKSDKPPMPGSYGDTSRRDDYARRDDRRDDRRDERREDRKDDRDRDRDRDRREDRYSSTTSSRYSSSSYSRDDKNKDAAPMSPRAGGAAAGITSPPPQNYGYGNPGPPPPKKDTNRAPASDRPPAQPMAPPKDANDREALWPLFQAVDKDKSGQLDERELRAALVNGDWSRFDEHTVRMMIRMFDTDRSGTINFDEFCGLWGFLAAWRTLFDRFDTDRSGNISYNEFTEALVAFGYRLSPQFVSLMFRTYDRRGDNAMSFDLFVQACISLKRMTDVFKKYDDDRDGYITLSL